MIADQTFHGLQLCLSNVRIAVWRMRWIHRQIGGGVYPNGTSLAEQLEISTKTIHRDIEFMRDVMGFPIEYVPEHFGYRYTGNVVVCDLCAGRCNHQPGENHDRTAAL